LIKQEEIVREVDTSNPLRVEELAATNEQMREQMKLLVDTNRQLKKEAHKAKTESADIHPMDAAKKKKASNLWKGAAAKSLMPTHAADAIRLTAAAALAEKQVKLAEAQFPKPPGGPPTVGAPPPGPKIGNDFKSGGSTGKGSAATAAKGVKFADNNSNSEKEDGPGAPKDRNMSTISALTDDNSYDGGNYDHEEEQTISDDL